MKLNLLVIGALIAVMISAIVGAVVLHIYGKCPLCQTNTPKQTVNTPPPPSKDWPAEGFDIETQVKPEVKTGSHGPIREWQKGSNGKYFLLDNEGFAHYQHYATGYATKYLCNDLWEIKYKGHYYFWKHNCDNLQHAAHCPCHKVTKK